MGNSGFEGRDSAAGSVAGYIPGNFNMGVNRMAKIIKYPICFQIVGIASGIVVPVNIFIWSSLKKLREQEWSKPPKNCKTMAFFNCFENGEPEIHLYKHFRPNHVYHECSHISRIITDDNKDTINFEKFARLNGNMISAFWNEFYKLFIVRKGQYLFTGKN